MAEATDPADSAGEQSAWEHERHRHELRREFAVMVLYVSIVLLATIVALPADFGDPDTGSHGTWPLIAVIWGTALGLALAHWFAFVVAAAGFRGGRLLHRHDLELAMSHVAGAALVALCTTLPVVLVDRISEVRAAAFVPAMFIGVAGYRVAKAAGRSAMAAVIAAAVGLVLGLLVASFKAFLSGY